VERVLGDAHVVCNLCADDRMLGAFEALWKKTCAIERRLAYALVADTETRRPLS
jgi:hypothetical protein